LEPLRLNDKALDSANTTLDEHGEYWVIYIKEAAGEDSHLHVVPAGNLTHVKAKKSYDIGKGPDRVIYIDWLLF